MSRYSRVCKSLVLICRTLPDEITARHSSLGGEFGGRTTVVNRGKPRGGATPHLRRRQVAFENFANFRSQLA